MSTIDDFMEVSEQSEFFMREQFRDFSFRHIALGEVDPVYTAIKFSDLSEQKKKRMIFSHLMVYDFGRAIQLCEIEDDNKFYDEVLVSFENKLVGKDRVDVASRETHPSSRTRGTQLPKLRTKTPEEWVQQAIDETTKKKTWIDSVEASKNVPTFGDYFGFKLADMIETIFEIPDYKVDFDEGFRKTIPRGTLTGYEFVRTGSTHKFRSKEEIRKCELLENFFLEEEQFFSGVACPQRPNRTIGAQEIETLLCDYRKCCKGTLKQGDKIEKLVKGLDKNVGLKVAKNLEKSIEILRKNRDKVLNSSSFSEKFLISPFECR